MGQSGNKAYSMTWADLPARHAVFASEKMSNGNVEVAERIRNWGSRACRATSTDSEHQQQAAEDEYHRIMSALEKQLHLGAESIQVVTARSLASSQGIADNYALNQID